MSARDELEVLIKDSYYGDEITRGDRLNAANIAYDIIAAGWRPPMRVIETVEELEALPLGTMLLDRETKPMTTGGGQLWDALSPGHCPFHAMMGYAPFRVVWEPEQ